MQRVQDELEDGGREEERGMVKWTKREKSRGPRREQETKTMKEGERARRRGGGAREGLISVVQEAKDVTGESECVLLCVCVLLLK